MPLFLSKMVKKLLGFLTLDLLHVQAVWGLAGFKMVVLLICYGVCCGILEAELFYIGTSQFLKEKATEYSAGMDKRYSARKQGL